MKIKNYGVKKTYFQKDSFSIHLVSDTNGRSYFLRLLDAREDQDWITDKWYDLYENYQFIVTNYKYLPRVHSIDSTDSGQVFTTFSFEPGQFISSQHLLTRDGVEQLLDAVSHLHAKGLAHGRIRPENIWVTDEGGVILYGSGEEVVFGRECSIQGDLQQVIGVLSHYSVLEPKLIRLLSGSGFQNAEEIRQQLINHVSPGLAEKEKQASGLPEASVQTENRTPDRKTPSPVLSNKQSQNEAPLKKRRVAGWIAGGAAALVVLAGSVWGGIEIGSMHTAKASAPSVTKNAQTAQSHPAATSPNAKNSQPQAKTVQYKSSPPFDQAALNTLYPTWQLMKSKLIHFPDHDVTVAGIAQGTSKGQAIVVQYDFTAGKWVSKWSGGIMQDGFYALTSLFAVQSDSQKRALVLATANTGVGPDYGEGLALTVDDNGTCQVKGKFDADALSGEQQGNTLVVNGDRKLGEHKLSLQGEQFEDLRVPASQQSPAGAVQVAFKLDSSGNVVAAQSNTINIKAGQTIAFIPADDNTRQEFDNGNIDLFTDGGQGNLGTYDADAIWSGNSFTFDKSGMVEFLLITTQKENEQSDPNAVPATTFTVYVQ